MSELPENVVEQEEILKSIISKTLPPAFSHIRKMKDLFELNLTVLRAASNSFLKSVRFLVALARIRRLEVQIKATEKDDLISL